MNIVSVLKTFRLFDDLPDDVLKTIEKRSHYAEYGKSDVVASSDDMGRGAFFLFGGGADMTQCGLNGDELILGKLAIGDWCGAESTLCNEPLGFDIIARKVSIFVRMPAKAFLDLMAIPIVSRRISNRMAEKVMASTERLVSMAFDCSRKRSRKAISEFLTANPGATQIPAGDLAKIAGVARETLSREISMMVQERVLSCTGRTTRRKYQIDGDIDADPEVPFSGRAYRSRRTFTKVAA